MPAAKIQNDLRILTERLARINDNLARKITSRNEYDKTIQETEAAYSKVSRCRRSAHRDRRRSAERCCTLTRHGRFSHAYREIAPPPNLLAPSVAHALMHPIVTPACALLRIPQIMESSQTLLHVLKRESVNLTKKKAASS